MKFIKNCLFVFLMVIYSCTNNTLPNDTIPQHDSFTIQSKILGELRTINVWVPSKYYNSADSLPVMYMADGGIKEDFPHIANTLNKLITENKIKPLILVGIENTERRRDLTGITEIASDKEIAPKVGGAINFRNFISIELFNEINKRYKTTPVKSIIGESLSGLFVMETFFLNPEMFDNYIAFDPSLWWNNHSLVRSAKDFLKINNYNGKRIWFAGSSAEDISKYTKELANILQNENVANLKWKYSDEPQEHHNTIFRATKEKAIIWTLNN